MKKLTPIIIILASTLLFTACKKTRLVGEGSVVTDTRSLASIRTVEADGDIDVEILPGTTNSAQVTGYGNLVAAFETNISGGTLRLKFKNNYINVRNNNIHIKLYVTGMDKLHLNGSGDVHFKSGIPSQKLETEVNGSGNITFDANQFDELDFKINGSGNINAKAASCNTSYADISGSGDIDMTVNQYLDAKISGSGTIDYWGNPATVNTNVSGSGKVRKN